VRNIRLTPGYYLPGIGALGCLFPPEAVHRFVSRKVWPMRRLKSPIGLLTLCLLLVAALMAGPGLGQNSGDKGGDWKNVTILYTTDVKGKIEPCG
jgi:hypothetical protein